MQDDQHAHHDHAGVATSPEHTDHEHTDHDHAGHDHADHDTMAHDHAGHGDHSAHDPAQFRRKFWLSLVLTIPTLVFSTGLQDILGLSGPRFPGSQFIPAVFGIAIFVYGGLVFLRGAVAELRGRQPGMMTLISLAIVVALGYSLAVTVGLPGMDFWWELATLITIMLLGHWIEMSAVMGAQNALGELAKLLPDEADMLHGEHVMTVPVSQLKVGDLVLVRPGAAVPVDGEVVDGESEVDEALLTGESAAVAKAVGAPVIGGSVNGSGALTVRVTKVGADTALAGITKLVEDAQSSRSSAQLLADKAAALLFYVALGAAILTLVAWLFLAPGDPAFVLERVVSVLVIACPHALGLAIPLVSQISTGLGARNGILVKNRLALEEARSIDVVLFDKTGTLTTGTQGVVAIVPDEPEVLRLAAAVEAKSEHPIARAIVTAAKERELSVPRAKGFAALSGRGASATVEDRELSVVSGRVLTERGLTLGVELVHATREHSAAGATVVYLVEGESVLGMLALADTLRPESSQAVAMLRSRGVRVAMLTGDSHEVGQWVAGQLGIDDVHAEVLPAQKSEVVRQLQADGSRVAMVGDGVNDAPALAQADLGIAIGAGTDVAIESADVVLMSGDLRGVVNAIALSKATIRNIRQNLFWAFGYNAALIPVAGGVLYPLSGTLLSPVFAAGAMALSSIFVLGNALRLKAFRPAITSHERAEGEAL